MLVNKTKAIGCFLSYAEPSLAEFVAFQGWDFLVFGGEHGPLEPRDVQDLCRAADVRDVTPMSREWQHYGARYITTSADGFLRNVMHEFLERVRA